MTSYAVAASHIATRSLRTHSQSQCHGVHPHSHNATVYTVTVTLPLCHTVTVYTGTDTLSHCPCKSTRASGSVKAVKKNCEVTRLATEEAESHWHCVYSHAIAAYTDTVTLSHWRGARTVTVTLTHSHCKYRCEHCQTVTVCTVTLPHCHGVHTHSRTATRVTKKSRNDALARCLSTEAVNGLIYSRSQSKKPASQPDFRPLVAENHHWAAECFLGRPLP